MTLAIGPQKRIADLFFLPALANRAAANSLTSPGDSNNSAIVSCILIVSRDVTFLSRNLSFYNLVDLFVLIR